MKWSHNDNWMVTADHKGVIKYWQSNMNNLKMIEGHKEAIRDLSCVQLKKFLVNICIIILNKEIFILMLLFFYKFSLQLFIWNLSYKNIYTHI
jgi:hypothetical protein